MSTRRQRPSLGSAIAGPSQTNKPTALEAFEDFRRRHVRQNKEIVIDNALRRTTVATLQEEIAKLHIELLELRQTNVLLSSQVKRLQVEATRNHSQATREAIDQILGAIPVLRRFRDTLGPNTSSSIDPIDDARVEIGANSVWTMESKENPTATRPAAAAASGRGLPILIETSEYGSDAEIIETDHLRVRRVPAERRRTEIGSVAVPRSPRPNNRPKPSDYFVIDRPESSARATTSSRPAPIASPSPRKVSRSPIGKMKKRRESGLLLPRARSKTPPSVEIVEEIPDWEEGRNVTIPSKAIAAGDKTLRRIDLIQSPGEVVVAQLDGPFVPKTASPSRATVIARAGSSGSAAMAKTKAKAPVAREIIVETSAAPQPDSQQAISSQSPPLSVVSNTISEMESFLSTDENGGRGRRARRSVNYKEPSLTKKMRKPDGITVEEILGGSRASLLPVITEPEIASSSSAQSKRVLQHVSGPRRKSVLPRAGINRPSVQEIDEEDEEELDLSPDLAGVVEEEQEEHENHQSAPSDDGEYIPSTTATPISVPSIPSTASTRVSTPPKSIPKKTSVVRTSPRKTIVPKHPDIGASRAGTTVTQRIPSGPAAIRTALGVRAEDNGVRKSAVAAGKVGTAPRRPVTTVRRQSSAV